MPFFYSNTGAAAYSEAEHTFAAPLNWTASDIQTLVLYFHGSPGNTGQLYVKVNGFKVDYDGDAADIVRPRWKQWNIDLPSLASLGVNLQEVRTLGIGVDGSGAAGTFYFDDIRVYGLAPEIVVPSEEYWIEAEAADTITLPFMVYDDPSALGGKYIMKDPDAFEENDAPTDPEGTASYTITVEGGTYTIAARVITSGDNDSFWFVIPGASMDQALYGNPEWVMWASMDQEDIWGWENVKVWNQSEAMQFTMDPGTYTMKIGVREDESQLDVIVITRVD
jgi:hypothetical protein